MEHVGFNPPVLDVEQVKLAELAKSLAESVDDFPEEYDRNFIHGMSLIANRVEKGLAEFSEAQAAKIRQLYDRC